MSCSIKQQYENEYEGANGKRGEDEPVALHRMRLAREAPFAPRLRRAFRVPPSVRFC